MKIVLSTLSALFAACFLAAAEPHFGIRFLTPSETTPRQEVPPQLAPYPVLPPEGPWRTLATETEEFMLFREVFLPRERAVLRYPLAPIRLFYRDGDVYGEFGNLLFLLPESAMSGDIIGEFPRALDRPFIRNAFGALANFPMETPEPPHGGKARYTTRITDLPLRRGCFLPDGAGTAELKQAADAGANLIRVKAGEHTGELLDAAQAAGVATVLDGSAHSIAALLKLAREFGEHPALAGIMLGGGPGVYDRALAVREVAEALPLYVSADVFRTPEGFAAFEPLPLADVVYTADLQENDGALPAALADFRRRSGAKISVRVLSSTAPRKLIDAAEKLGWEWCAPYPAEAPYTHLFRRNER